MTRELMALGGKTRECECECEGGCGRGRGSGDRPRCG